MCASLSCTTALAIGNRLFNNFYANRLSFTGANHVGCVTFPWFHFRWENIYYLSFLRSSMIANWTILVESNDKRIFVFSLWCFTSLHFSLITFACHLCETPRILLIYLPQVIISRDFVCFGRSLHNSYDNHQFSSFSTKIVSFAQQRIIQHLTLGEVETL